jgi:hypothetical protein
VPYSSAVHFATDTVGAMTRRNFILSLAILGLFAWFEPARGDQHDCALEALQAGEVASLGYILRRVRGAYYGQVIEAELACGGPPWVYQVKMVTPQGHIIKLLLDAQTIDIFSVQGHGAEAARK